MMPKTFQHVKTHEIKQVDRRPNEDWFEVPSSLFDVLVERHPEGSAYHNLIKDLGSRWSVLSNWRMRQTVGNLASEIETEARSFDGEHSSVYHAESMIDLALACKKYLELFECITGLKPGELAHMGSACTSCEHRDDCNDDDDCKL